MDSLPDPCRATNSELHQRILSDLSAWVDTLKPEPTTQPPLGPGPGPGTFSFHPTHFYPGSTSWGHAGAAGVSDTWTNQIAPCLLPVPVKQAPQALTAVSAMEENTGIRLVHALLMCADLIQRGDFKFAALLLDQMTNDLLPRVNSTCGIGKVAAYFIEALTRRLCQVCQPGQVPPPIGSGLEYEVLYRHFYEAGPYLKFSHFTANQAILEAFNGHDCVHIIDLNLIPGLQWQALLEALAVRPGGAPFVKVTGIGPPSENGSNYLLQIGSALAQVARLMNVRFSFRAVAASQLEDINPSMLETGPGEALAVNSIFQLHRLIGSGIKPVLNLIRGLKPKIVTLVEQEANHNQSGFYPRFTEALYYYSTMFDSLDSCPLQPEKALAELYLQREISNIICCDGPAWVERHEPLGRWRTRMRRAGFKQVGLGHKAFSQASMLLSLGSPEGYYVEERDGSLKLGWHSRPLLAASAWQVDTQAQSSSVVLDGSSSSSSSSMN